MKFRRVALARIAVVLLLLVILASALSAWLGRQASDRVSHTLQLQRSATRLWNTFVVAENGERGFVITGDDLFLKVFEDATARFPELVSTLRAEVADNPEQVARVDSIAAQIQAQFVRFNEDIAAARAGQKERIAARIKTDRPVLDDIAATFAALQAAETDALDKRERMSSLFGALLFLSILVSAIVAIAVLRLQRQVTQENIEGLEVGAARLRSANESLEEQVAVRTEELSRSQERAQALALQLADQLKRFDLALRGSAVTAFTQDRDLRFTWISRGVFSRAIEDIVGRTDVDLLGNAGDSLVNVKRRVIETGEPSRAEVLMDSPDGERWYDVQLEATRAAAGEVNGLMGVLVDVTGHHERESRIQLLLREITHRSKNLLAVIQSMARQTALRTESRSEFVEVFAKRIQSLALSHDLLIQGDWAGAPLRQVVQLQLAPFAELTGSRIEIEGEDIQLKPEAAQGLGMAVHELVTNAAKFGALSVPDGRIHVSWRLAEMDGLASVHFEWRERDISSPVRPGRHGFGHVILEGATARSLSGRSGFSYREDGATWSLDIPAEWVMQ